ncbi:MAG: VOC family protein, partial [Candidatus Firestonebacteria bacterium]|nr:VOC family protein [Candidatus Firestonebacteria bacterium]
MTANQKITPHLWFDTEAKPAAGFYTSVFSDSRIKRTVQLHNTPSGSVDLLTVELLGQEFSLISAGPYFKINPSLSFLVACTSKTEVDVLWARFSQGGKALMELGEYPFSARYGWVQDKYGVSWQLMFMGDRPSRQRITPTLMFTGKVSGQAEEALGFYTSVFPNSHLGEISRYNEGEQPDPAGTIRHASFTLAGQEFAAMDSAREHSFGFNEAVSLIIHCD